MPKWRLTRSEMKEFIDQPRIDKDVEYENAYWHWYRRYCHKKLDRDIELSANAIQPFVKKTWLRSLREAYCLTYKGFAKRLGIKPESVVYLENSEERGSISMRKLEEAAAIFNCELVYFLVPKRRARLSEFVFKELYLKFKNHCWVTSEPPERRAKAIASTIDRQMRLIKVRKENGWSLPVYRKVRTGLRRIHAPLPASARR